MLTLVPETIEQYAVAHTTPLSPLMAELQALTWERMGRRAAMMSGHVETPADRVEHMPRIGEVQEERRGFRAFFSWTFRDDGNRLGPRVPRERMPTSFDYLLTQAVSRIYLDNVEHIQSSWVTQGMKIGQVALGFGADDMGSVMIEENVVSAAGAHNRADERMLRYLIREAGFRPQQRDILYRHVHRDESERQDATDSATLRELTVAFAD